MKKIIFFISLFLFGVLSLYGTNRVVISEIMYDTPLNEQIATGNPYSNGEYIELYNFEKTPVNLTGWKLTGGGVTEVYNFSAGTIIGAESFILIAYQYNNSKFDLNQLFSRLHTIESSVPPIYQRKIILSNSGETVSLIDNTGKVVDHVTYDGTSNKTKPDRLSAGNEDDIDGWACKSLQRSKVQYDNLGRAIFDANHWSTSGVTPFKQSMILLPDQGSLDLSDNNYIHTRVYVAEDGSAYYDQVNYYDGLGYLEQTVDCKTVDQQKDLVSLVEYDEARREIKQWLPVPVTNNDGANNLPSAIKNAATSDYYSDSAPYSETKYELLASNQIDKCFQPGEVFRQKANEKSLNYEYDVNSKNEVLRFAVGQSGLELKGYYPDQSLGKNTTIDEDGRETCIFTDLQNRTILSRTIIWNQSADTYYVYDICGRQVLVITPEGTLQLKSGGSNWPFEDNLIKQYCYYYQYDGRGNITERRQPGREPELFIYDAANRLTAYRDENGDLNEKQDPSTAGIGENDRYRWTHYEYDEFGRLVREESREESAMHLIASNSKTHAEYRYGGVTYSQNDDPNQKTPFVIPAYLAFAAVNDVVKSTDVSNRNTGLKIYEKLAVIDSAYKSRINNYVQRAFYYDNKNRVIQAVEKNHLGGINRFSCKYDFTGNIITSVESVQPGPTNAQTEMKILYNYDLRGRQLSENTYVDNILMAQLSYEYDDLGRLRSRISGTGANAIQETLAYNINGWRTSQHVAKGADTLLKANLYYYDPKQIESTPEYTGNITEWEWQHKGADIPDYPVNSYGLTYDKLGRLSNSQLYSNNELTETFTEAPVLYDLNGNPKRLIRSASDLTISDYVYEYNGNQLTTLTDKVDHKSYDYSYDVNGNMTHDGPNNLDLKYNYMNLVENVKSEDGILANYSYLSDGTKFSVTDADGNGLVYSGSLVYRKQGATLSLESAAFSAGRFIATTAGIEPRYFITDHLGSVRVIVNHQGEVIERNDYYPFGMRWEDGTQLPDNRYLFNGKEDQNFVNVPYADYGARMLDSKYRLGWLGQDLLAEKNFSIGSYVFCANNPICLIDNNGKDWYSYEEEYEDENCETKTRTRYKYIPDQLSENEMPGKGYTYMGKSFFANNTYYSLFGAQLTYEPGNTRSMDALQTALVADMSASIAIKAFRHGEEFWDNYNQFINTGSDAASVITEFAGISKGLKTAIGGIARVPGLLQLASDVNSIRNENMHGEQYADAVFNVISMIGWKGSAVSLGYHTAGKPAYRGSKMFVNFVGGIPQAINNKIYSIRDYYVRMGSF